VQKDVTVGAGSKVFHVAQIMSILCSVSCHDSCGLIMLESQAQGWHTLGPECTP